MLHNLWVFIKVIYCLIAVFLFLSAGWPKRIKFWMILVEIFFSSLWLLWILLEFIRVYLWNGEIKNVKFTLKKEIQK